MKQRTLDQDRSAYAWTEASKAVDECGDAYVNLAKGAGALIMSNGLMATLAYYQDKSNEHKDRPSQHHIEIKRQIMTWLNLSKLVVGSNFVEVMKSLHGSDSQTYRMATQETLDLLRWIRQFAAAVASTGKENRNG
jgi:CRISPR-associated protein Cmr5